MAELLRDIVQGSKVFLSVRLPGNAVVMELKLHSVVKAGVVGVDCVVKCMDLSLLVRCFVHGLLEVCLGVVLGMKLFLNHTIPGSLSQSSILSSSCLTRHHAWSRPISLPRQETQTYQYRDTWQSAETPALASSSVSESGRAY